jgi:energy-converting hydrogenase Eha subunit F
MTQGRDIDNLMAALNELRKPFSLIRTLIMVYAVLILIGLIAVLIAAFTNRPA